MGLEVMTGRLKPPAPEVFCVVCCTDVRGAAVGGTRLEGGAGYCTVGYCPAGFWPEGYAPAVVEYCGCDVGNTALAPG